MWHHEGDNTWGDTQNERMPVICMFMNNHNIFSSYLASCRLGREWYGRAHIVGWIERERERDKDKHKSAENLNMLFQLPFLLPISHIHIFVFESTFIHIWKTDGSEFCWESWCVYYSWGFEWTKTFNFSTFFIFNQQKKCLICVYIFFLIFQLFMRFIKNHSINA